jgi:hypothetical protein
MSETLQIPVCGSLMLSSYTLIIRSSHLVLDFELWSFGFVSCFVLRISNYNYDLIYGPVAEWPGESVS